MARKEKRVIEKKGNLIYQNDNLKVWNDNDKLSFHCDDPTYKETFISDDYLESVSAIMRLSDFFKDEKVWKIQIPNKYDNIKVEKALYWLTGGVKEWEENKNYKYKWEDVELIFKHKFEDTILEIIKESNTLGDIKRGFMAKLNLPIIYEFSLNNNLI
jgi:hypothetical protein